MKTIETVEFMCEYCGTKHARRDHAESCERNCYIQKMSNCELCIHYREHIHIKSPPTRLMKKVMKRAEKWMESYCRCLKFYRRDVRTRGAGAYSADFGWGDTHTRTYKDYRNGLKGMSCPLFEEIK